MCFLCAQQDLGNTTCFSLSLSLSTHTHNVFPMCANACCAPCHVTLLRSAQVSKETYSRLKETY
jgi:hypothetical protein